MSQQLILNIREMVCKEIDQQLSEALRRAEDSLSKEIERLRHENDRLQKENDNLRAELYWAKEAESTRDMGRLEEAARNGDVYL